MNIKKSLTLLAFTSLLVAAPVLLVTSCSSTSKTHSDESDVDQYNFVWNFNGGDDKKTILPSKVTSGNISSWYTISKVDENSPSYESQYKAPSIRIYNENDSDGSLFVDITFNNASNVLYLGSSVTSISTKITGLAISNPTVASFNWGDSSDADKKLFASDKTFDSKYIWDNWVSVNSIYTDKYHNIPEMKITPNESIGTIKVDITFEAPISINGTMKSSDTHIFTNFLTPAETYKFSWGTPPKEDTDLAADNAKFDEGYIWTNWMSMSQTYKDKYSNIPDITITTNKSAGTIKVDVIFETQVTIGGSLKQSDSHTFTNFYTTPGPEPTPTTYNVNWLSPSEDDKENLPSNSDFNSSYILDHWVNIDSKYTTKYGAPSVTKETDDINGTIKITINFKADITIDGKLKTMISTTFHGFATQATIYNVYWISPSDSDKNKLPSSGVFNDEYILNNWVHIDQAYITKYGKPTISTTPDDDIGSISITIKFQTEITINGKLQTSITTNFQGFKTNSPTPPPPTTNAWVQLPYSGGTYGKFSSYKSMSLIDQAKKFCVMHEGLQYSDVTKIDYAKTGEAYSGYIKGKVTITFKYAVKNGQYGTERRTVWSFTGTFAYDPLSVPTLQINDMSSHDKSSKLPSSITADYIETNLIKLVDSDGNKLEPKSYISRINLHPDDAGGYLEYSIIFNDDIKRETPNGANEDNYATPSKYWNINVADMKTNGKPYKRRTGYYPDWAQYGGHASYKLPGNGDVGNYNDYIMSFIQPHSSDGHIGFMDGWGDFDSDLNPAKYGGTYSRSYKTGYDVWPNGNKYIFRGGLDATVENGGIMGEMNAAKSVYGFQTSMSIGGWSNRTYFAPIMCDETKRQNMIGDIIALIERWGFDNVDIDWEYPMQNDKANFVTFLKELRAGLDASNDGDVRNTTISTALSVNITNMQAGLSSELNNYVDYFNLMSYDMHGSFDNFFGNMASLDSDKLLADAIVNQQPTVTINNKIYHINNGYFSSSDRDTITNEFLNSYDFSTKKGVDYLTDNLGFPSSKILIGGAFYTRGFFTNPSQGTPIKELPGLFARKTGTFQGDWEDTGGTAGSGSYAKMANEGKGSNWGLYTDEVANAQYYYNSQSGKVTTTDTPYSITQKCNYINNSDLGGMIVWDVSGEWDGHSYNHDMSNIMKNELSNSNNSAQAFNVNEYYNTSKIISNNKYY